MPRLFFLFLSLITVGCSSYTRSSEGIRYFGQSRYNDAMSAFQKAQEADPNNPDVYYNIAATYHQSAKVSMQMGQQAVAQQQFDEAVRTYQQCLVKSPNHTAAYRGLAALYMDCADAESAFNVLLGWTQANPVASEPKIELARLYQEYAQIRLMQGSPEDCQKYQNDAAFLLQKVIATDPSNFRAHRALGFIKEQSQDYIGAIAEYRSSLQSNPNQKDLGPRIAALEQGAGYLPPGSSLPASPYPSSIPATGSIAGATVF